MGVALLFGQARSIRPPRALDRDNFGRREWATGSVLGSIFGLIMGATSIGAGSLMIAPMVLVYRLSSAMVVGTTIGVSVVLLVVGTVGYLSEGLIDWSTVLFLSIGAVPAVVVGSSLTTRLSDATLIKLVAVMMALGASGLIVKGALII